MSVSLPGPGSLPAQVRLAVSLLRDPAGTLLALHRHDGPVVAFGYGPFRYVALFGPYANRYLLAEHPENFRWREALASLIVVDGDTALVVSDGDDHRRRRRLVQPAFSTRRIQGHLDVMVAEADRELDRWQPGEVVDAFSSLRRAIRRIAVRTLFGDSLGERADELGDALTAAIAFVNRPISLQVRVDLPGTAWHRAKAARDRADGIVNAEIARRRTTEPCDADLLYHLLGATDDGGGPALDDVEVRDQVVSLIAAGYDTTSAAAGWVVHELLVNGEWDRAAAEVSTVVGDDPLTVDHLRQLVHLDAVINETLRLWPPGFVSARKAVDDFELAGHSIPGGSMVLYSPYVTHRSPDVWPDPDRFRPERWTDAEPDPYAFVPFGGGYRRCIGFAVATQELRALLVQLLRRTRLTALRRKVRPTGYAALRPAGGVPVRVGDVRAVGSAPLVPS
ncbi:cytochrome P450 [soil metagenome]